MDNFKLRAKCKETGEWIYGTGVTDFLPIHHIRRYPETSSYMLLWTTDYEWVEIIEKTLGKDTGFFDKNDGNIFEGDILYGISIGGTIAPCVVEFYEGSFIATQMCNMCSLSGDLRDVVKYAEIKGNIWEE